MPRWLPVVILGSYPMFNCRRLLDCHGQTISRHRHSAKRSDWIRGSPRRCPRGRQTDRSTDRRVVVERQTDEPACLPLFADTSLVFQSSVRRTSEAVVRLEIFQRWASQSRTNPTRLHSVSPTGTRSRPGQAS
jgi:hypothetical protein